MAILHARIGRWRTNGRNFSVSSKATELYIICHSYIKYVKMKQDEVKSSKKTEEGRKGALFATLCYIIFMFVPCINSIKTLFYYSKLVHTIIKS